MARSHCQTHEETVHVDMKEIGTLRGRVRGAASGTPARSDMKLLRVLVFSVNLPS